MGETDQNKTDWVKNEYNMLFKAKRSQSFIEIYRKAYGEEFPEELDPNSYVTRTDLQKFVRFLKVKPNATIIDVGCGRGGPGMWIAREIGTNYFGFDLSEIAIELATSRVKDFGLEGKAQFKIGDICSMPFSDKYFDAAISIDVLLYVPNVSAAISEVSRILRSNAKFVFTTWEKKRPSKLNDYRLFLRNASFEIEDYEETPDWEQKQCNFYQLILDNEDILIKDMGIDGSHPIIMEAKLYLPVMKYFRRIFVVAKKI